MAGAVILAAILLAGATVSNAQLRDYKLQNLDLIRILTQKPWAHRWDHPNIDEDLGHPRYTEDEDSRNYSDDFVRPGSEKRSAVATALNGGRRRRQPAPALGKAVTPYVGVGVLNDVGTFFDSLRDNLETLASLSPQQRSTLFQEPPTVVQTSYTGETQFLQIFDSLRDNLETLTSLSPQQRSTLFQEPPTVVQTLYSGGGGGGSGIRKLHALRPLRPTGNMRSYNRRSDLEAYGYPGANHHDPGLLWTGLGR